MKAFILAALVICAGSLFAVQTEVVDGVEWSFTVSNGQATIERSAYPNPVPAIPVTTSGDLTIPSTLGGCPVTSLGNSAFNGCSALTSVVIPEGVTSIGWGAFSGCSSLTSVVIPEGVTVIDHYAFSECSALTSVVIPEGVTSIGYCAFAGCSALTSVVIPEGVTSIGGNAFSGCSALTSVVIPEGVTSIGSAAFYGCSSLTSAVIPEGVTSIGWRAFFGCRSLTSVVIPEGVTSIGSGAFSGCSALTSVVIPEGVTSIGGYAFEGCSSLTSVVIPEGLTSIESAAFRSCSSLTSVVIPEGVTSIGSSTFSGCSSLTSVVIPEGVTSIGDAAFYECSSLTSVVIPEGVTSIGGDAFEGCSSLTSVVIPEGVTSIGGYAFRDCSSLTSVVIPESVTTIGDAAFYGCSSLTSVVIPEGVTSIGGYAFSGCRSLTSVVIPEGVTSIEGGAFYNCSSLTSVVIPEGVTSIEGGAFYGCRSLTSVVFPESLTAIGSYAFRDCSSLTSLQLQGPPPEGASGLAQYQDAIIYFPQKYGAAWEQVLEKAHKTRFTVADVLVINRAKVDVRAEMATPETMKVSYTVTSDLPSVKVRAVAFKDGVRSFANIVPVRTGEGVPLGESVKTNVEHTFVWEVASDWKTDLDKVAVEILVQGETGTLLPQEQITIPATETHKAMTITRNALAEPWLFDALVWCVAEGDEQLQIADGVVSVGGVAVANGNKLIGTDTTAATALLNYLYGKMGHKVLAGEELAYAKTMTRLDFASEGLRQVSVKIDEGESATEWTRGLAPAAALAAQGREQSSAAQVRVRQVDSLGNTLAGEASVRTGEAFTSVEAPERAGQRFTHWEVSPVQPGFVNRDAWGRALDAVTVTPKDAEVKLMAVYANAVADADGDGVADAEECYWYGVDDQDEASDTDGDGYTFAEELQAGMNPLFPNRLVLGGVATGDGPTLETNQQGSIPVFAETQFSPADENLLRDLLADRLDGVREIRAEGTNEAILAGLDLGIVPATTSEDGTLTARFEMPTLRIVAFDPQTGTARVRVIPAAGATLARPLDTGVLQVRAAERLGEAMAPLEAGVDATGYLDAATLGEAGLTFRLGRNLFIKVVAERPVTQTNANPDKEQQP